MIFTDQQLKVIRLIIGYLENESTSIGGVARINNKQINISLNISWFDHLIKNKTSKSKAFQLTEEDAKKRLNFLRDYYLVRLQKDYKNYGITRL